MAFNVQTGGSGLIAHTENQVNQQSDPSRARRLLQQETIWRTKLVHKEDRCARHRIRHHRLDASRRGICYARRLEGIIRCFDFLPPPSPRYHIRTSHHCTGSPEGVYPI